LTREGIAREIVDSHIAALEPGAPTEDVDFFRHFVDREMTKDVAAYIAYAVTD
jgi:hypothetical protein